MRTFHTGGVAGLDITAGLPRVEELFEARMPKGKAEISHIDGVVEIIQGENGAPAGQGHQPRGVRRRPLRIGQGPRAARRRGRPRRGQPGRRPAREARTAPSTRSAQPERGLMVKRRRRASRVRSEDVVEREYAIPHNAKLLVENGQHDPRRRRRSPTGPSTRRSSSRPAAGMPSSATWSRKSSASTAARA